MLTDTHTDTGRSEFADSIPLAATAGRWNRPGRRPAKRNRQWEKAHRPYRYVNVPLEVREDVWHWQSICVPASDVAHAFFEYGFECVDEGKLSLTAQPNPLGRKMTLFPQKRIGAWEEAEGPQNDIPARKKRKVERKQKSVPAVSYRVPPGVHMDLCSLAEGLAVPVGDMVTLFLQHGLKAYRAGRLKLMPHPVTVKMTLKRDRGHEHSQKTE
ncbi:MAG: hypothetical protein IPG44_11565 [Anaerolineales bacterium]|nr:hypothetical protein [Anaerolineales bacterium]